VLTARFWIARVLTARFWIALVLIARLLVTVAGSELATLAFLVVLRVLMRLFFSIDMAGKLLEFLFVPQTVEP